MSTNTFTEKEKQILLTLVKNSIKYGLENKKVLPIQLSDYPERLQEKRASFITLEINDKLRGCIGCLEAYQPLVLDIANNAYRAAFCDPRFPPITKKELPLLTWHISILSCAEPILFSSEKDLLNKIRPRIDGLIFSDCGQRATFLPSVWDSLETPKEFLQALKGKAGFDKDYWSDTVKVERYTTITIE